MANETASFDYIVRFLEFWLIAKRREWALEEGTYGRGD